MQWSVQVKTQTLALTKNIIHVWDQQFIFMWINFDTFLAQQSEKDVMDSNPTRSTVKYQPKTVRVEIINSHMSQFISNLFSLQELWRFSFQLASRRHEADVWRHLWRDHVPTTVSMVTLTNFLCSIKYEKEIKIFLRLHGQS